MKLDSPDALFYALAFFVPGFIAYSTLAILEPRRADRGELTFLRLLTLSAFDYAIWSWLIYLLLYSPFFGGQPLAAALLWGVIVLVGPAVLGVGLGYASQRQWVGRFLQRLGLKTLAPVPTAWDWRFFNMRNPHWIFVTLKDGSTFSGLFGPNSYASSDPTERDIYIEQLYLVDDRGEWAADASGKGILVGRNEIRSIELWPRQEALPK